VPTGQAYGEQIRVPIRLLVNGNLIYDTLDFSCTALPGTSIFNESLVTDTITFPRITQCDKPTLQTFTVRNIGCDILRIDSVTIDETTIFSVAIDSMVPRPLAASDSIHVTVGIVKLDTGIHTGELHFYGIHADSTLLDTLIPISAIIDKGIRILQRDTVPIDLGKAYSCQARDTTIIYTNTGTCPLTITGWHMSNWTFNIFGNGVSPPIVLQPGQSDSLHITYWNGRGSLQDTAVILTDADNDPVRRIPIFLTIPPLDSVRFEFATSSQHIVDGTLIDVDLAPDRSITGKGLQSISGILNYYTDAFDLVSIVPMQNASFFQGPEQHIGRRTLLPFRLSSSNEINLDPSTPILHLQLKTILTDTNESTIFVDSLRLNDLDPKYGECSLATDSRALTERLDLRCGEDLLQRRLQDHLLFRIGPAHPNPISAQDQWKASLPIETSSEGVVTVSVSDALGRPVLVLSKVLAASEGIGDVPIDLSNAPAGCYYYAIGYSNGSMTSRSRGSLLLIR
jgi:hypothetical protein